MCGAASPYDYQQQRVFIPRQRIIYLNRPPNLVIPGPYGPQVIRNPNNVIRMPAQMPPPGVPISSMGPGGLIFLPHGIIGIPVMQANAKKNKGINNPDQIFEEIDLTEDILEKSESKECSICLDDFKVGDKICYLPCFHFYHAECIKKWVHNSNKCPVCNYEMKFN